MANPRPFYHINFFCEFFPSDFDEFSLALIIFLKFKFITYRKSAAGCIMFTSSAVVFIIKGRLFVRNIDQAKKMFTKKRVAIADSWQKKLIKRELAGHRIDRDYVSSIWGSSQCLYQKDLIGHFCSVHAAEFSHDGQLLASGKNN